MKAKDSEEDFIISSCETCQGLLSEDLYCHSCKKNMKGYTLKIKNTLSRVRKSEIPNKRLEDLLAGPAQIPEEKCPSCGKSKFKWMSAPVSFDEPLKTTYFCCNEDCKHTFWTYK